MGLSPYMTVSFLGSHRLAAPSACQGPTVSSPTGLTCVFLFIMGDAIYHRTRLGDSLLHVLQKFCIAGELEGAEARRIIADFNEVSERSFGMQALAAAAAYQTSFTHTYPHSSPFWMRIKNIIQIET